MKLKKFAAMMLAGVMAVSMLAGCSTGVKPEDPTEEPTGTNNAATVLNDEWDNDDKDKVEVNFTYSNSLEDALKQIVAVKGEDYTADDTTDTAAEDDLAYVLDVDRINSWTDLNGYGDTLNAAPANTDEDVVVSVYRFVGITSSAAMKDAAEKYLDNVEDKLNSKYEDTTNKIDYAFSYTGEAAMYSVENDNGQLVHYIAYVMTSNTTRSLAN